MFELINIPSHPKYKKISNFISEIKPGEKPVLARDGFRGLDLYYVNPIEKQDLFYNEVLEELYDVYFHQMDRKEFRKFYFTERAARWNIKLCITQMENFIAFEYGSNTNSSERFLQNDTKKMSRADQGVVKTKLQNIQKKFETVEGRISEQRKLYQNCFIENASEVKRSLKRQSEWHQQAISDLSNMKEKLEAYKSLLVAAQKTLHELYKGVGETRLPSDIDRRKRQNKKRLVTKQKSRNIKGSLSFLNSICKVPEGKSCFPSGIEKHKTSEKTLTGNDLLPISQLEKIIKPARQAKYLKLLKVKNTFDSSAIKIIDAVVNKKTLKYENEKNYRSKKGQPSSSETQGPPACVEKPKQQSIMEFTTSDKTDTEEEDQGGVSDNKDQAGVSDVRENEDQAGNSDEEEYVYDPIDFSDQEEKDEDDANE